jgi:hypothetical protein
MHPVLNNGKFAIMTASDPVGPSAGNNVDLAKELHAAGYTYESVEGKYKDENTTEHSFLIHNPDFEHIKTLGKKYGQESVILSHGGQHRMHYTFHPEHEGKAIAGSGHQVFGEPPKMYYTRTFTNGRPLYFTLNFDWDKSPSSEPLSKSGYEIDDSVFGSASGQEYYTGTPLRKSEEAKYLIHFGVKAGLSELDPKFMGSSWVKSAENKHGVPEIRRTYFYREGTTPEEIVSSQAKTKYYVREPHSSKLYDLGEDPRGHVETARTEMAAGYGAGSLSDRALGKIRDAGYEGFYNSTSALPNVVALFHKASVAHEQPAPSTMFGPEGKAWLSTEVPVHLKGRR